MSQRRILAADEDRDRHRNAISAVSVVSTGSSSTNLLPFEGLTHDEVAFVDSIINRVPSSATTFVPVFKAYQDEFEDRELNATDDQFYYNLLLKLGMIRADNWQARWSVVKEHFGYQLEAALEPDVLPEVPVASPRASLYRANFDEDDDAFTLHSHAESGGYAAPPSYASKRNRKIFDGAATSTQKTAPRQGSSVGRMLPRVHRPSSLAINMTRHRLESVTTQSTQEEASQLEANSPTAAVPPSYHTYPQVAPEKPVRSSLTIRDDAETWRVIEMERNADMFRRDSLLSRCLEVWVQGLHWVETTTTRLDNARTEFILRSILVRWREKSATAIKETKRAASMDRVRLLNSSLSKWRLRAWTRRRKRWADEMRDRRIVMQNKVAKRQLAEFFTTWRRSHSLCIMARQHQLFIMQQALSRWTRQLHRVVELSYRGDQLIKHTDSLLMEKTLESWKRQVQFSVAMKVLRGRQADGILWNALRLWQQKTHVRSVACGFSEARILRNAVQTWTRRRARLKHLERRAIAHQNKPLVRAIFHIWVTKTREQQCTRLNDHRVLAAALQRWKLCMERHRNKERNALIIAARIDQRLLQSHLTVWAQRFASRKRLERRSQRAYEVTLKAKVLIGWRQKMRVHTKALKEAKLVHRLFLQRTALQMWREVVEERTREKRLQIFLRKRMGDALRIWANKTKLRRTLRRKGDVMAMAVQTRVVKDALQRWTLRVVFLKDREYCVLQERRDKVLRHHLLRWKRAIDQQHENTSLMMSFQDVRREEIMRRILNQWLHATRRKQSLAEREGEFSRSHLSQAFDRWRDRFLENNLRPVELDVLLQSHTNLLFKMFRLWEARTPSIPAIRFHAQHIRADAWKKWKAAMPAAMKRKEAREHDQRILLGRALFKWRERYRSKISLKAMARARYLRLPPAPAKPTTSRLSMIKQKTGPLSYRSASPDGDPPRRPVSASIVAPEISRAPSPTSTRASFQGLGGLARRRPTLTGPSSITASSRASQDGKRDSGYSWDGIGATRARARVAFSAGFGRPGSVYRESKDAGSD